MNDLKKLFEKDERVFAAGTLFKNKLTELALKFDKGLIELLLSDKKAKEHFFTEKTVKKNKVLIFDKDKFISFVNNKEFLPDSFTSFKNKIGLMDNGNYLKEKSDVVLAWAYKDCVLVGGQDKEDQKRDEVFYNETLAPDEIDRLFEPKVLTNFKKYDSKGEHKVTELSLNDNLIIKGNNLLALHCLKKKYRGKVKLIYIDPPFNTGNDEFRYNDRFNHSTWLTFMKNRLETAKELLSEEGSIYVHLDFNEAHYCKVLMDEIFGRSNFQREIIWRMGWVSGYKTAANNWIRNHDDILFYVRNPNKFTFNKTYIPYPPDYERWGGRKKGKGLAIEDVWGVHAGEGINSLAVISFAKEYTGFRTQKPESLLKRIIEVSTNPGDIVLDFCLGTGTTAAVAHKMGRQYIGIEQLDYGKFSSEARLKKVIGGDKHGISKGVNWKGGGSFIYIELKKWNEEYMAAIQEADTTQKLLNIYKKMKKEAFFRYDIDLSKFDEKEFKKLSLEEQQQVLCECLDKNHLYVNLSEMDDATYKISAEDKKLNKQFYKPVF